MEQIQIKPEELRAILADYEYNDDVMNTDDERVLQVKKAISKLSVPDRTIFVLYVDLASSRKLGKILGVSRSTVLKEINRIKLLIRSKMMEDCEDVH